MALVREESHAMELEDGAGCPESVGFISDLPVSFRIETGMRNCREMYREVREERECADSDLAEFCRSFMRSELEEMRQQISSIHNAFQKLMETSELANNHSPHLGWANAKSTGKNDVRNLRLWIRTKLSDPLFTRKKLEGEGGACISVAVIDANTRDVVRSGPESSIKLDVVVLEGDFNKDDEDNWALEEFENYVVKERERKGPLLTGDLQVTLKEGVGELGELIFTDNSSWNRSKRFRIGLKVASSHCGNTRIREAKTDAFRVKEHRGESNKKHYPPASDDEVWRLEKIAKDGISHRKLSEAGIHKVEDFLRRLAADSKNLREVLGKSMTQKNWECLVKHAETCKNWRTYLDYPNGMRKHAAVLNTDGQKTGLTEDTEPGDTKAVDNWNDVREFNGETFSGTMQKKSSSTFPSQVFEGQTENLIPVQCNLAPLANAGSTVEGHNGATALPLPAESQNTDCGVAAMTFSADGSVPIAAHHPIYADPLNVLYSPGDNAITAVGSPVQPFDVISQFAMPMYSPMLGPSNPMDFTVDDLDLLSVPPPHDPMPSFQCSSAVPRPEGDPGAEDSQLNVADDWENFWSAIHSSC